MCAAAERRRHIRRQGSSQASRRLDPHSHVAHLRPEGLQWTRPWWPGPDTRATVSPQERPAMTTLSQLGQPVRPDLGNGIAGRHDNA